MNEKNNYLLSGPELVAVSTKLAEVSYDGMTTVPRLLAKMEISPYRFNLNKPLLDVWFDIVKALDAGISKEAGYGADAVATLIEHVARELPGNEQITELAHNLARNSAPASTQPGIFLSHAGQDMATIESLRDELLSIDAGLNIFLAHLSIQAGQAWLETLRSELGTSSMFVAWVSSHYIRSPFCHYEYGIAESNGALIVPIVSSDIPPVKLPAYIAKVQCLSNEDGLDKIAQTVVKIFHSKRT